jgi:mevalonate kinase
MHSNNEIRFFSPGKILLTAEYLVMDGALALAVPSHMGQSMVVKKSSQNQSMIHWESFYDQIPYLSCSINYQTWEITSGQAHPAAETLRKALQFAHAQNAEVFDGQDYHIACNIDFPADYGLGSSATFINNLAQWTGCDAFALNQHIFGGSAYDIAVAQSQQSILYQIINQKPSIQTLDFNPNFADELIFVHLNQKQNSREAIAHYKALPDKSAYIAQASAMTKAVLAAQNLSEFAQLMTEHEVLLSKILQTPTVKERLFADCPSFVKSLGAWGGDFVLSSKFNNYQNYFENKAYGTIIDYKKLINTMR